MKMAGIRLFWSNLRLRNALKVEYERLGLAASREGKRKGLEGHFLTDSRQKISRSGNSALRQRRWISSSMNPKLSQNSAEPVLKEVANDGWSLRARIGMFSAFFLVGGFATLSYSLTNDNEMLFYVYEKQPWLVNLIGPYIGLPIAEETGALNEEKYFPRSISDLVGDSVTALCKLRSGRVVVVQALSDTPSEDMTRLVCEKLGLETLGGDKIASITFVDEEEEQAMLKRNDDELRESFSIKLEPLPVAEVSREALMALLNVYRANEVEFQTQINLGKNHGFDYSRYEEALVEVEKRKVAVKKMMKSSR